MTLSQHKTLFAPGYPCCVLLVFMFYFVVDSALISPLQYLCLLLCIFLLEIIAGVLAYITYQEVTELLM